MCGPLKDDGGFGASTSIKEAIKTEALRERGTLNTVIRTLTVTPKNRGVKAFVINK